MALSHEQLLEFVDRLIIPLFPGAWTRERRRRVARRERSRFATGSGYASVFLRAERMAACEIEVYRSQPFDVAERSLLREVPTVASRYADGRAYLACDAHRSSLSTRRCTRSPSR